MTSDDWKTVEDAFQRVLDLPEEDRDAFLERFSAEHPHLEQQLRDLLAAHESSDDRLSAPIEASVDSMVQATADPWVDRELGAWTITRRIASGGMGAVFLAERSDKQFEQRVAIKIMSAQLLASDAVARFKAERQILANLKHPYIAQLHDGGTTEDGLPYLVMEYIDGQPIDQHCDDKGLSIDQRLRLFQKVCEAVDHAHRNLTVHRDLKPSNILIDPQGDPKLLDFGIAKLLDASAMNLTVAMTHQGARAMTPEYASPEQVRGEPVSVATDVYSLGVLLYRLMTGTSPYGKELTSPLEYERAIIEYDPQRPSTVVTQDPAIRAGTKQEAAVKRLQRRLIGDLDNIVLKALQKEADRRYVTVSALSSDVERFLRSEPVEARGDDWFYTARKFTVRNARALSVAGIVVLGIASLVTFYTIRLADERDRANLAAAESNEVSRFLTELFESASTYESQGEPVTAVDMLEQGRLRIDQLDDQPMLQAELNRIMGSSLTSLGYTDQSIPMLESALVAKEAASPRDELSIAETLKNLSEAHRQHGETRIAEDLLRRALAIREAELGSQNDLVAYTKARLGVVLFDARKNEEGLALLEEALATKIALGTGEDSASVDIRGNIGNALDSAGRYDEAVALFEETIELSKRVDGEMHPNTIIRMSNMALTFTRQGRYEESVEQLSKAIELGHRVWPDTHDQLAFMIGARAANLKRLGRMDESLQQYELAAEITRRGIGEQNTRYVARLRGIGSVLMDMGRYEEARAHFDDALSLAIELDGDDGYHATLLRLFLGRSNNHQEQYAMAESYLRHALPNYKKLGASSQRIGNRELAVAMSGQGRFVDAEALLLESLAAQEESSGPESPTLLAYLKETAAHYRRAGELEKALQYAERANVIAHSEAARQLWIAAVSIAEYANTLRELGQHDAAREYYRESHAALAAIFGPDDSRVTELAGYLNLNQSGPR